MKIINRLLLLGFFSARNPKFAFAAPEKALQQRPVGGLRSDIAIVGSGVSRKEIYDYTGPPAGRRASTGSRFT